MRRSVRFASGTKSSAELPALVTFTVPVHDLRAAAEARSELLIPFAPKPKMRVLDTTTRALLRALDAVLDPPRRDAYVGIPLRGSEFEDLTSPNMRQYVNLPNAQARGVYVFNRGDRDVRALGGVGGRAGARVQPAIFHVRRV